jgi:hypothetical protein
MFQLAPVISVHYVEVVVLISCLFIHLITKMSSQFLEQRINVKFCVKLGKYANDTCAVLSKAYGGEAMKKSSILGWHKWFKKSCMLKSQMKMTLVIIFDVKNIVHFDFLLQDQSTKLIP